MMDYKSSGVDIDAGTETVRRIKGLARATFTPGVLSEIGSFGGLFTLGSSWRDPVLVSSADGVGTKLKIAFMTGRHDTIGIDLVNHCVNDILVQGAVPLFFLDYLATGKLSPDVAEQIVKGLARGCQEPGADAFELNLACPHMDRKDMGSNIGKDQEQVSIVTEVVKEVATVPVWAKLTPSTTEIVEEAGAAFNGGADATSRAIRPGQGRGPHA